MKTVEVTIEGLSALLMNKFPMEKIEAMEKLAIEEQAEHAAHRDPDTGELYIPGVAIYSMLVAAATYSKGRGRATLQKPAAACIIIEPERCSLGVKEYTIDSRPVVISATRGRIMRHRPRLDKWKCSFGLTYDAMLITAEQMRRIVDDGGSRVGLLDFRPAKKGPFGRFMVTNWMAV